MSSARIEDQIEEDNIEEEALLEQENRYERQILRNENFTAQNPINTTESLTSSTTTTSATSTRTTPGPQTGIKEQTNDKPPDNPPVNNLDDREAHRCHGLCRSNKCISHWACRDPLLHCTSVCDRLTELLHTRRRYNLFQLILKLTTLIGVLCFVSLICFNYGRARCEMSRLTNTTTASQHSDDTAGATSGATARATTSATSGTISDDENQDEDDFPSDSEDLHLSLGEPRFKSGNYEEETQRTYQTEQQNTDKDFMFDEEKNDSESIVISFWPK